MNTRIVLSAVALATLVGTTLAAMQMAMADERLACLPPAVIQALS